MSEGVLGRVDGLSRVEKVVYVEGSWVLGFR